MGPGAQPSAATRATSSGDEFVFASAVEGLYLRALKGRITPELRTALHQLGLDVDHVLPAYALDTWEHSLRVTCGHLFPDKALDDAMAELGRQLIAGYQDTAIGKAIFPLMRILGPARVLARMSRNFQSGNNYTDTRVTMLGPSEAVLWFNRVIQPAFYRGILEAGLFAAGAKELSVELGDRQGEGFSFRIRWT